MNFDFKKISGKLTGAVASYFTVDFLSKNLSKISPELAANPMYAGLAMIGLGIFIPDLVKKKGQTADILQDVGDSLIFAGVTVALPSVTGQMQIGAGTGTGAGTNPQNQLPGASMGAVPPNEQYGFVNSPKNKVYQDYINGIGCPTDLVLNQDGQLETPSGDTVAVKSDGTIEVLPIEKYSAYKYCGM